MRDEQQIKEMTRDICRVQSSCNDVCNPAECCTAWKYANRAYDAGYRKQDMENTVYVAYKKYFNGGFIIMGVYHSPDDARRRCDEAEEETYVAWADWDSFEIR